MIPIIMVIVSIIINNNSSRESRSGGRIKIWKYLGSLNNKKQYFLGGLETLFSVVPEHLGSNWWVSLLSTPADIGPEGLQKSWSETSQCGDVSPGLWLKQLSTSSVGQVKWNLVFPFLGNENGMLVFWEQLWNILSHKIPGDF